MPDRVVYSALGLWALSLAALLVIGRELGETVVLVLFCLMMGCAAFIVASCYGLVGLLRLLALALLGGVCVAAVTLVLPEGVDEVVAWLGPIVLGVLVAAVERRKRRRQRVIILTTSERTVVLTTDG
ncbi:hypothetical protein OM076_00990 [Solirubrobacter ginsenosidimutans]|uniref:Uncharacterized protein n=1 Tax=Solirubrobacter ginsenosidimutans TaxID=490573 RepID=A0A9X3MLX6_9ACTN|nr:hypothetical protein [Solirubrobacter ginsenosidimutans]MDA0158824.1 hypothetical protein [Solirubrobacter ginsenosidimutans]